MANLGDEPKLRQMTESQVQDVLNQIESGQLSPDGQDVLRDLVHFAIWLQRKVQQCQLSIRRLKRLFGFKTEKQLHLFQNVAGPQSGLPSPQSSELSSSLSSGKGLIPGKKKGHGKNGASDYPHAKKIFYPHENLKKGDACPECQRGRLVQKDPGSILKLVGQAPIAAEVHQPEKLRCSGCQQYFTAKVPEDIDNGERLDSSAKSICALMKYSGGVPFYRLSRLQGNLGHLLPPSTQWDAVEDVANCGLFPFLRMMKYAAENGKTFQVDDTGAKILLLKKELREIKAERQGIFLTGILVKTDAAEIAIFQTGNKTGGEHLDLVLQKARFWDRKVHLMSDASSNNLPKSDLFSELLVWGKCLDHSRRYFLDALHDGNNLDKHAVYFIRTIAKVYRADALTKKLSSVRRLRHHQKYSLPIMEKLQRWAIKILNRKRMDPESALVQALKYYLRHYPELTAFTRVEGMPISNIALERLLKIPILNRKNAMFHRTEVGSKVADILMSLIETCNRAKGNPFEYLTELQKHRSDVSANPDLWLPWNYQNRLRSLMTRPVALTPKIA